MASAIYRKALKMLKRELYFEIFFPTDTEKEGLPYRCWTSAVASMRQIEGGTAFANKLFYVYGYNGVVSHIRQCFSSKIDMISPSPSQLDKRISSIRNTLVMKSKDCHDRYYSTKAKKSAALKDDRYVYPGDPVSIDHTQDFNGYDTCDRTPLRTRNLFTETT